MRNTEYRTGKTIQNDAETMLIQRSKIAPNVFRKLSKAIQHTFYK